MLHPKNGDEHEVAGLAEIPPAQLKPILLSHGWINLPPFERINSGFAYSIALDPTKAITLTVSASRGQIKCSSDAFLNRSQKVRLHAILRRILSLDFPIATFIEACRSKKDATLLSLARRGWGRMLRSATPWEDAVKTLCTTNASWPHTIQMCRAIVKKAGSPTASSKQAFPSPSQLLATASVAEPSALKLGYRLPYVLSLAERAMGVDDWLQDPGASLPKVELEERISHWRGFGPYAKSHFLVLMGFHSSLPIDREVAMHLGIRKQGKKLRICGNLPYAEWGEFQFTAYKLTRVARRLNWIGD